MIDGEIVAFDPDGRPSFNALQTFASAETPIVYYVFDLLVLAGREVRGETLEARRELLERRVLPRLTDPVQYLQELDASLRDLVASVKAQGLEGLVAKRRDSRYEPGLQSGAWQKMRVNQGQEFVIGGYTVGSKTFDALIFRVLRGRQADLRGADTQRIHAGGARAVDEEVPRVGDQGVPVRQPARGEERPVGGRSDATKEGLPLAEASRCWRVSD